MTVDLVTVDRVEDLGATEVVSAEPQQPPPVPTAAANLPGPLGAVDARLTELADRLGAIGNLVESTQARVDSIEASEAVATGRVATAEGRLDTTDSAVKAASSEIASMTDRLDTTDSAVKAASSEIASMTDRLDTTDSAVKAANSEIASMTERLASVDLRLDSMGERLGSLDDHIATLQHRAADHDRALVDVARTIAAEVERHTTDALVDSRHSLQLAVNSIAQLSLALAESSRDITEDVSAESATTLLDSFRVDLDAILAQLGFEPLGTTIGDAFDPHRHRALKRVPTSDPAGDKAITLVIRDGYRSAGTGRILLFADVEVGRHRP